MRRRRLPMYNAHSYDIKDRYGEILYRLSDIITHRLRYSLTAEHGEGQEQAFRDMRLRTLEAHGYAIPVGSAPSRPEIHLHWQALSEFPDPGGSPLGAPLKWPCPHCAKEQQLLEAGNPAAYVRFKAIPLMPRQYAMELDSHTVAPSFAREHYRVGVYVGQCGTCHNVYAYIHPQVQVLEKEPQPQR